MISTTTLTPRLINKKLYILTWYKAKVGERMFLATIKLENIINALESFEALQTYNETSTYFTLRVNNRNKNSYVWKDIRYKERYSSRNKIFLQHFTDGELFIQMSNLFCNFGGYTYLIPPEAYHLLKQHTNAEIFLTLVKLSYNEKLRKTKPNTLKNMV
jgi:hypothetical protein